MLDGIAVRGDHPAVITVAGETVETHACTDIADRVLRLAAGLRRHGVAVGEPVALFAPNSADWLVARLAIAAAGAVAAAIDDLATSEEAAMVIRDGGCRRILAAASHLPELRSLAEADDLEVFVLGGEDGSAAGARSWTELFAERPAALPPPAADAPAMLVYTSGTTGRPKSFALTNANIAANVEAILGETVIGPEDRLLLPLPLHHVYPFVVGALVPLSAGAAIVLPESATGQHVVRALKLAGATGIVGVPRLYEALLAGLKGRVAARGRLAEAVFSALLGLSMRTGRRFGLRLGRRLFSGVHRQMGPELRLLVSAGAKLEAEYAWQLQALGWEVLTGYGLAETASAFTGNLPGRQRIGSEGRPLNAGEIRIGDGEIQLRGPSVFAGYRNNPEANREAFTPDGWFRTGDQGHLDAEGYLYVTGRIKELIVLGGGKNVQPEEVEKVYGASPYIREVAVLERSGALVALVVPDLDAIQKSGSARIEDVVRVALTTAGKAMAPYQRLSGFAIMREPLPRTRLGKYRRFQLQGLYEAAKAGIRREPAALSAEDRALLARSPGREIWALLKRKCPEKPLGLDASPQIDLGIDSLEWLSIGLELEAALGIRVGEDRLAAAESVRALIAVVEAASAEAPASSEPVRDLSQPSAEDERWLEPPGPAATPVRLGLYGLNWLLMRLLFRLRVTGLERLPPRGPFVIAANHASDLDPLIVAAGLPYSRMRRTYWGGDRTRLFGTAPTRWLAHALNVFPVDERAPSSALAMATAVLSRGESLIWFPESWRTPTGGLQAFLPGLGRVLSARPVPVVPAYIRGTFEALPRDRRVPRLGRVELVLGSARSVDELMRGGRGDAPALRIVHALRQEVATLAGEALDD